MLLGVDYYPEQWDRALWEEDAVRMRALGAHVIRIGEFAWSRMEPKDGGFDFAWLDDAIETISRQGMQVILGTPTNCAPGQELPTVFRNLCGCHVTEYDPIGPVKQTVNLTKGGSTAVYPPLPRTVLARALPTMWGPWARRPCTGRC